MDSYLLSLLRAQILIPIQGRTPYLFHPHKLIRQQLRLFEHRLRFLRLHSRRIVMPPKGPLHRNAHLRLAGGLVTKNGAALDLMASTNTYVPNGRSRSPPVRVSLFVYHLSLVILYCYQLLRTYASMRHLPALIATALDQPAGIFPFPIGNNCLVSM